LTSKHKSVEIGVYRSDGCCWRCSWQCRCVEWLKLKN